MNHDTLWDNLYDLSVTCGMNQRYAQSMLTYAEWRGSWVDGLVLLFTVLTATLGGIALYRNDLKFPVPFLSDANRPSFETLSFFASFTAALFGVMLFAYPASRDIMHFKGMLQSWSDLRQDVDSAIIDVEGAKKGEEEQEISDIYRRYRDLLSKKNALNAREPAPRRDLLVQFQKEEEQSRGARDENGKVVETATSGGI